MLLAIDTSTQTMEIALYSDPLVAGEMIWRTPGHHTIELAPAVEELLQRCSVQVLDLQAVAVALGPGSFTSLRIGLALAKGLALSLRIPIIGIPTFDYMAEAQPLSEHPLLTVLPAGRKRMAVQRFRVNDARWQQDSEPLVLTPEEISDSIDCPTLVCGEMTATERQVIGRKWKNAMLISPALSQRRPSLMAEMAWKQWKSGKSDDPISLSPIYLHIAGGIQE